jgi:hypothetical protein
MGRDGPHEAIFDNCKQYRTNWRGEKVYCNCSHFCPLSRVGFTYYDWEARNRILDNKHAWGTHDGQTALHIIKGWGDDSYFFLLLSIPPSCPQQVWFPFGLVSFLFLFVGQ